MVGSCLVIRSPAFDQLSYTEVHGESDKGTYIFPTGYGVNSRGSQEKRLDGLSSSQLHEALKVIQAEQKYLKQRLEVLRVLQANQIGESRPENFTPVLTIQKPQTRTSSWRLRSVSQTGIQVAVSASLVVCRCIVDKAMV